MTIDEKREYCYKSVTLNGIRAAIRGALLNFPLVWQLDAPFLKVNFSWDCIERVVSQDCAFHA